MSCPSHRAGATSDQAFLAGLFKDTLSDTNPTVTHTVTVPVTANVTIPGAVRASAATPAHTKTPRPSVERGGGKGHAEEEMGQKFHGEVSPRTDGVDASTNSGG